MRTPRNYQRGTGSPVPLFFYARTCLTPRRSRNCEEITDLWRTVLFAQALL
jgi:hypothetical protein